MVSENLVEVPSLEGPLRTSRFKVVAGEPMVVNTTTINPMWLNMTTINHIDKSILLTKAIYQFKGNFLTYCVGAPGQPRPTDFKTTGGDGNTRVVLKRPAPKS